MATDKQNENNTRTNWLFGWLIGLFGSVILGGGGAWLTLIHGRINEIDAMQRDRGERMSRLEATVNQMDPRIQRIENKMDSIDQKIDLVLKRR